VLREGVGTCSTKHALLAQLLADRPDLDLRFVHRVYRVDRDNARELFGRRVADALPPEGLVDVHTYATVVIDDRRTVVDVTFPSDEPWDGHSDMKLACGEGIDHPVDGDPWSMKDRLVAEHCDPASREKLIRNLADNQ
jgi:hypothetical protein